MTPMAGGIADREEYGFVFTLCLLKGLITPWKPVNGIIRVLQQIWTRLELQAIASDVSLSVID